MTARGHNSSIFDVAAPITDTVAQRCETMSFSQILEEFESKYCFPKGRPKREASIKASLGCSNQNANHYCLKPRRTTTNKLQTKPLKTMEMIPLQWLVMKMAAHLQTIATLIQTQKNISQKVGFSHFQYAKPT